MNSDIANNTLLKSSPSFDFAEPLQSLSKMIDMILYDHYGSFPSITAISMPPKHIVDDFDFSSNIAMSYVAILRKNGQKISHSTSLIQSFLDLSKNSNGNLREIFDAHYRLSDDHDNEPRSVVDELINALTNHIKVEEIEVLVSGYRIYKKKELDTSRMIGDVIIKGLSTLRLTNQSLDNCLERAELMGAGFVNFKMTPFFWLNAMQSVLEIDNYGVYIRDIDDDKRNVNVEYVSANPTGPMHIGHMRLAVYGDIVANIMSRVGYNVTREYYINDDGSQIDTLLNSTLFRYRQVLKNDYSDKVEDGMYPGDYLIDVGKKIAQKYGDKLSDDQMPHVRQFVLDCMMDMIKNDLMRLGVRHDIFVSERSICRSEDMTQVIEILKHKPVSKDSDQVWLYYSTLSMPHSSKNEDNWKPREQLLFRSTVYGDDVDRPLQKEDGSWTYFATDIGYHYNKYRRGFQNMYIVLGADHKGYASRLKSSVYAMGCPMELNVIMCELVNFIQKGDRVKMSKRAGNFVTVADVLDAIDKDIIRFMMITKHHNTVLDFDVDLMSKQSKDNALFYAQYAYSRCCSILAKAEGLFGDIIYHNHEDVAIPTDRRYTALIRQFTLYNNIIKIAVTGDVHILIAYLMELVAMFHVLWQSGNGNDDLRFILPNDVKATRSRLMIVRGTKKIIESIFDIIGITALSKM